jgi:long-chain acyl-CoA synthetase
MLDIQPTCMTAPPSFYQKLYSSIHESMSADSALRQALFRWAIDTGEILARCMIEMRPYTRGQRLRHRLTAMILRDKIMRFVGRRVRFLISGGVALPGKIEELFYAAGIQIYQGYGLTESASLVAINSPGNFMFGTAGKPLDQCEVRISEQGEILARGPNMMAGYYKVRGEAIDAFDEERWLRTGDLGILENGFLRYLGRKTA